jgi:transposase-like protein
MDFPIVALMDQDACYQKIVALLHPEGLACPRCAARKGLNIHRRHAASPVIDYRCKGCRRVFNAYTGTPWQGTHFRPATILLIVRGITQGVPTAQLARELGLCRTYLLKLRHEIQARAQAEQDRTPLPDAQAEADEMYQNAGEKRGPASRSMRPPPAARQPGAGPRHVGHRSATGSGGGGSHQRSAVDAGGPAVWGRGVDPRHGAAGHGAGGDGVHRRLDRVPVAVTARPQACDGQP